VSGTSCSRKLTLPIVKDLATATANMIFDIPLLLQDSRNVQWRRLAIRGKAVETSIDLDILASNRGGGESQVINRFRAFLRGRQLS